MSTDTAIIAVVGMPGAGKSIASDFFRERKIPILRFGDQTDIGLQEHGLERNEKNERWYREKLRKELGMAAMAIKIEPRIRRIEDEHHVIVLDGLYSWEEYIYLEKKFPNLTLLCIYAPPAIRHERLVSRNVRPLTKEEAKNRDVAELENLNKGGPIAVAHYLIKNETTPEDFQKELDMFYRFYCAS
ncbi:MAG: AAA family ATPase [bacterium]|nr:AAA family ATPase [bacterium]